MQKLQLPQLLSPSTTKNEVLTSSISHTLPRGLMAVDGKMTLEQKKYLNTPRKTNLTGEQMRSLQQGMRLIAGCRKTVMVKTITDGVETYGQRIVYELSNGLNERECKLVLAEAARKSDMALMHLFGLAARKPPFNVDAEMVDHYVREDFERLKEFPEYAIWLACENHLMSEDKWYPNIAKLYQDAKDIRDAVYMAFDFFLGEVNAQD